MKCPYCSEIGFVKDTLDIHLRSTHDSRIPFPDRKYNIIYADPPWEMMAASFKGKTMSKLSYPSMKTDDICKLPVQDICEKDCFLFLWVTNRKLGDGLKVMEAWGFDYKTIGFTWIKSHEPTSPFNLFPSYMGLGCYTRPATELCLLGTKGSTMKYVKNHFVSQLVKAINRRHSEKPHIVREKIVQLLGDIPRIELFARQKIHGWDQWGNEVPEEV